MGGEEVIELSVEETNKLRAELGLKPLRLNNDSDDKSSWNKRENGPDAAESRQQTDGAASSGKDEILEMSIDETNKLRAKLGLKPLNDTSSSSKIVHKPAENDGEEKEIQQQLEHAKLRKDVQKGVAKTFGSATLADEGEDNALSWADRMRRQKEEAAAAAATTSKAVKKKKKSKKKGSFKTKDGDDYDSKELEGLHVAHNVAELESGSTTVLTLADASILETDNNRAVGLNEDDVALENVNLTEQKKQKDGLRKKRMLELGMGRAGGYSGFDDEEFEELGGTLGPARTERGGHPDYENDDDDEAVPKSKGFRIGSSAMSDADRNMTDYDKIASGKAISLQPAKGDVAASDYMTFEEEEAERAQKKKKKDSKFKKKKKKDKKDKKNKRRTATVDSDDEDDGANLEKNANDAAQNSHSLLEQLEKTAAAKHGNGDDSNGSLRKRRRSDSEDDGDANGEGKSSFIKQEEGATASSEQHQQKRSRYEEIMAKGNERTNKAFHETKKVKEEGFSVAETIDEPDDSFLNAALEKARRLNRLRALNKQRRKGADVVTDAVQSIVKKEESTAAQTSSSSGSTGGGTLTFAIDDTREFTRALRARSQQNERKKVKQEAGEAAPEEKVKEEEKVEEPTDDSNLDVKVEDVPMNGDDGINEAEEEDVDMEELAKEVKLDDVPGFEGTTSNKAGVGRGLSSVLSMLKQTGEINPKLGNKEELRGRAKDERNYDNYEKTDLSKVVKIGRNATDKDKEMASREIKLEYRDSHGRLLSQKQAFRELCYQFHGHGAGKKKEEKMLKQISHEQAEARLASRQVVAAREGTTAGTLGALKATQKATGKAFIVHKT